MLREHYRRYTVFVTGLPQPKRRAEDCQRLKPQLETLEPRLLMTASPWDAMLSSGGICNCAICTGQGLPHMTGTIAAGETIGEPAASNPLTSIPLLSSKAGATAKLVLDFNGNTEANWGGYLNVVTKVYDQDGDQTTFSDAELASIQEIWARVAEDYAPFNIDVTTIDPGGSANGVIARIAIGGNYSDWYGSAAGGVAYVGGFYNSAPNVGYVFEDALGNGNARYVAEAASHEAGHLFGLQHQSLWTGSTLSQPYYQGNADWAPIMGVGYYSERTTWHNGTTNYGPSAFQDDMSILANASNGFGYRTDDYGSTQALASALIATAGNVNMSGRISTNTDEDWFSFTTSGGALNLSLNVAQFGANLDSVLEVRDSTGTVIASASPTNSLSASLTATLTSGTYFVVAKSTGGYGNVGQYTLTGTVPGGGGGGVSAPEIAVSVGSTAVLTGGTVNFGSVQVGQYANQTITFTNTGNATLTLTQPTALQMPAGFSIITNFATTSLAAGASTTLVVRFTPTAAGNTSGTLTIASNDADEGAFAINLTGTATPAPQPEITVSVGTTGVLTGGTVNFGSVQVGQYVNQTITFTNTGNATLTLTQPTALQMPAGFSIITNFASTSLAAGASTTLVVRFTPTAAGNTSGTLTIASNDADEGSFAINLAGTATPAPEPEITVSVGTTGVLTGGSVNFGTVQVGQYVNQTITFKNTGNGTLTLTAPTALQMPAGFSIVTNFASTTLAAGASTTLVVRFTPTAAGNTSGTLTIASNDADEGSFAVNLAGTATPGPQPEITVSVGTTGVLTGGTVNFGSVQVSKYANQTITFKNTGTATLTLVKPTSLQMPAGFSIVTNFATTSLLAGKSTTLVVRFTPTAVGNVSGVLTIASNDADEGAFAINLAGTATPGPQPEITVSVGTTGVLTGGSVNFGSVQVSKYANQTITFKNTGSATLTLVKPTSLQMPAGFSIVTNFATTSLLAGKSTTLVVRFTPTAVGNVSGVLTIASNDADEGAFVINLAGTATPGPTPEITVSVGTNAVLTGGTVDYGSVPVGQYLNQIITFKNTGTATLTLVKPTALQMPAGFTIITNFASTSLAAGQSTTLVVRFTPTAEGNVSGTLTIASNDADESAFAINLTGIATPAPIIRAIDNGSTGFTTVGNWTKSVGIGRESDVQTALKGNGGTQATWTFNDLPAGQYRIHASWSGSILNATNAPFTIFDGTTALGTVAVNQEQASSGFTWSGTNWSSLGTFAITGTTIRVQLGNLANDTVVADAIRVEWIGDLAPTVAAGSTLAPVATSTSTPTRNDSPAPLANFAPVLASSFSFSASSDNHLTASNVDSLFAETGDTHSELLLLSGALELVKSTHEANGSSDHTASDELSSDPIGENWLLGNELEAVLT